MARARRRRRKTKTRSASRIVRRVPAGEAPAKRRPAARPTRTHASAAGAARTTRRIPFAIPRPSRAETLLLTLAKDLADVPLDRALRRIADAFMPGSELPREVFNAWIKTRQEKTALLALSWAREQVRLSLEETLVRSSRGRPPLGVAPATLAWLLLAACEAMAYEPPSAVADRLRTVLELSGHAASSG